MQSAGMPATLAELVRGAAGAFAGRFGRTPRFAAAAPGRINIIGEHTDYNDGFALPVAIDRWNIAVADHAPHAYTTVALPDVERVISFTDADPPNPTGLRDDADRFAAAPIIGVFRQFQGPGMAPPNLDLLIQGSIPIGAGLSSSAALEVAVAELLNLMTGSGFNAVGITNLTQRAEHEWLGTPCGPLDMFIATHALDNAALLLDCRTLTATAVALPPAGDCTFLVVNTGVRHALADSAYADRRQCCQRAAGALGAASLRDCTADAIDDAPLDESQRRCALHVIQENQRTLDAAAALQAQPPRLRELGELLLASHDSLRDLFQVSVAELDCIVQTIRSWGHDEPFPVFGARMTGGGFGGCAIVLCPERSIARVRHTITANFAQQFDRQPEMFTINAVGPACAWTLE